MADLRLRYWTTSPADGKARVKMTGIPRDAQDAILQQWRDEIASIELDPQTIAETTRDRYLSIFAKALEELVPLVKITEILISANEEEQRALREHKKEVVIARTLAGLKGKLIRLEQLAGFLAHPYGGLLFHKICRIAENAPPVDFYLEALSFALQKCVAEGRFEQLFRSHKLALDIIEQLTPQDLFILQDYLRWPAFQSGLGAFNGQPSGDWASLFVQNYTASKNIADLEMRDNFALSLRYLCDRNFITARGGGDELVRAVPTPMAYLIIPYITP